MKGFFLSLIALVAIGFLSAVASAQQCNVQRQQAAVSSSSAVDLQNQAIANLLLQQQLQRPVAASSASSATAPQQQQPRFLVQAPQPIRLNVVAPANSGGSASSSASSSSAAPSADLQALLLQSNQQSAQVACLNGSCSRGGGLLANLKLGRRQTSRSVSISRSTSR